MKDFLKVARQSEAPLINDSLFERIRAGFYFTDYATGAEPNLETAYGAAVFREVVHGPRYRVGTLTRQGTFIPSARGPRIEDVVDGFKRAIAALYGRHVSERSSEWLSVYSDFFKYLSAHYRLGIVSTNYDLVAETALKDSGLTSTYVLPHQWRTCDLIPVLKLHGSVNWPTTNQLDLRDVATGQLPLGKAFVLPPTWNKDLKANSVFARVWADAGDLVRSADAVLAIGHSFPKTDLHLDYLFAEGLAKQQDPPKMVRVTVVDPDPASAIQRFRRYQTVQHVSAHSVPFRNLLAELQKGSISL